MGTLELRTLARFLPAVALSGFLVSFPATRGLAEGPSRVVPEGTRAADSGATAEDDAAVTLVRSLALSIQKFDLPSGVKLVLHRVPGARLSALALAGTKREAAEQGIETDSSDVRLEQGRHCTIDLEPEGAGRRAQARLLIERGGRHFAPNRADCPSHVLVVPNRELEFGVWFAGRELDTEKAAGVLAITGDFDVDTVASWVETYFRARDTVTQPANSRAAEPRQIHPRDAARALATQLALESAPALARLERLAKRGPAPSELTRAKNRLRHALLIGLESSTERAALLSVFETLHGDARLLSQELDRLNSVDREGVRTAARALTSSEPSKASPKGNESPE